MSIFALIFTLALLAIFSYWLGRKRSFAVVQGEAWKLHSLPSYYGFYTAIWCGIPALFVLSLWMFFETSIITHLVVAGLPEDIRNLGPDRLNLVVNDIRNLVSGNIVSRDVDPGGGRTLYSSARYKPCCTYSRSAGAGYHGCAAFIACDSA